MPYDLLIKGGHVLDPGQGLDGRLDIGDPPGLDNYQRWRRADALLLAAVTDGLNRLFSNAVVPVRLVRDVGLAMVNRLPPLKRLLMRHAMGLLGDRPRLARGEPL